LAVENKALWIVTGYSWERFRRFGRKYHNHFTILHSHRRENLKSYISIQIFTYFCHFLAWFTLPSCRRKRYVPPKLLAELHVVITRQSWVCFVLILVGCCV
jgi:hypothetical protein